MQSCFPGELGRVDQPFVGRPIPVGDMERRHDFRFGGMRPSRLEFDIKLEVEKSFVAAA